MALPVLFDNYVQISDVYRKDLGPFDFGALLQNSIFWSLAAREQIYDGYFGFRTYAFAVNKW
jgi:hypothetical protein